jgi:spermidine synthase
VMGPFRETFALVLAVVLLGLALGSWGSGRFGWSLRQVLAWNLLGLFWLLVGTGLIARGFATWTPLAVGHPATGLAFKWTVLTAWMLLPATTFGATVPALLREQRDLAKGSGQLLFVSSLGNAAGFLLMVTVLHRFLDHGATLAVVAGLVGAAYVLAGPISPRALAPGMLVLALTFAAARMVWREELLYLGHTSFRSGDELRESLRDWNYAQTFRGAQDSFSITWARGKPHFFINGFVSISLDSPSEKLVGAFSSLFAPRTDKALVLGLGSGATGGTVSLLFDKTDAVEINPVVIDNLFRLSLYNFDLVHQPGIRVLHDDAIHFIKAGTERYSLIVNTVTTPLYFSSSKLYTQDFLRLVRERLTTDGVYMTWMDSRVGDTGAAIMLRTLQDSFTHCALGAIKSTYYLVLCSQQPLRVPDPHRISRNPALAAYFRSEDIAPEWISYNLLLGDAFRLLPRNTSVPLNTLDFPALEFEIARLSKRGLDGVKKQLREELRPMELGATSGVPSWDPVQALVYLESVVGTSFLVDAYRQNLQSQLPDFGPRLEWVRRVGP